MSDKQENIAITVARVPVAGEQDVKSYHIAPGSFRISKTDPNQITFTGELVKVIQISPGIPKG